MVSSAAEEQRDWARLGARRQLEQPMDLEPREQPHAERRHAAAGDEPNKRRAVPAAAEDGTAKMSLTGSSRSSPTSTMEGG